MCLYMYIIKMHLCKICQNQLNTVQNGRLCQIYENNKFTALNFLYDVHVHVCIYMYTLP